MATSISKSVPRSRLNITYRTRIDGQVVPKELPLRLLIAGDFSGRGKVEKKDQKPLPPLSQRVIYSIGKDSTLDGVLSRARVSLPIPLNLRSDRTLSLLGQATVRVERAKNKDGAVGYLLSVKSSLIEHAVELTQVAPATASRSEVASDTKLYSGEVVSLGSFAISSVDKADLPAAPTAPASADAKAEPIQKWNLGRASATKAVDAGIIWKSEVDVRVSGNVTAPVSPAGEPPNLLEIVGTAALYFVFDEDIETAFGAHGRDAAEFRVRFMIPKAAAHRGIQVPNMTSFSPERVAMSVPNIRRLLVVRWLLSQGRSLIGSNPALRAQVKDMLTLEENRLNARKAIAKALPTEYAANLAKGKGFTATTTSDEADYAAKLSVLLAKPTPTEDEEKQIVQLQNVVKSEWWAAKATVDAALLSTPSDKDLKAKQETLLAPSPWNELTDVIKGLGLDHFKIEGDGK
jgi:predicted component of type VI protein secretion system